MNGSSSHTKEAPQRQGKVIDIIILLSLPLAEILVNPMLSFGNDHHCDTWIGFGAYFFFDQPGFGEGWRQLARLAAVLPGYFAYRTLPPMTAHYILYFSYYYLCIFSFYFTATITFGRRAALIGSVLLGGNLSLAGILSSDYSAAPALAYTMLSLAMISKAGKEGGSRSSRFYLFAGGFVYALSANSHLASVCYTFVIPLYYLLVANCQDECLKARMRRLGIWFSTGIVVCTIMLGMSNVDLAERPFLFFRAQLSHLTTYHVWRYPDEWFMMGSFISIIVFGVLSAGFHLTRIFIKHGVRSLRRPVDLFVGLFLLSFSVGAANQMLGGELLEKSYYAVWLLPLLYLSLIAVYFAEPELTNARDYWSTIVLAYCLVLAFISPVGASGYSRVIRHWGIGLTFALTLAALISVRWKSRAGWGSLPGLLIILAVQMGSMPNVVGSDLWNFYPRNYGRDYYTRVIEGLLYLKELRLTRTPHFWVKEYGDLFETIAYPRSLAGCQYMDDFPNYVDGTICQGDLLVIVDRAPDIIRRANESLRWHGMAVRALSSKRISKYGVSYDIIVCEVGSAESLSEGKCGLAGRGTD